MSYQYNRVAERINDWFHDRGEGGDDLSPQDTIFAIADEFEKKILDRGLRLNIPFHIFVKTLCDATCTMYRAHLENKEVGCSTKIANLPKKWTPEIETIWMDWVFTFHLTEEFWSDIWYEIQESVWEAQFPRFRTWLQSLLPNYLLRDMDALEQEGLVKQTSGGEFVDVHEEDIYEDDGYESR
jgi:hypothetical protein